MKTDTFWSLIPKGVKIAAAVVFVCALIAGPVIGTWQGHMAGPNTMNGIPSGALTAAIGLGIGLVVGAFVAFWLLSLGYVYADSRRRAMPAVLWVLVAIFVPNLLGFLLYFAIRRPLGSPCSNCGQLIAAEQRFCSWCGSQSFAPPPAPTGFHSPGSEAGPATTV
ncbi:MAG TPA: zinc ribbon domain-containing protein [Acidobacteriaceae bacterium]|nr:zinc ribbon domain-containing protein [Acidobacteriaceae bacterium]